MAWSGVHLHGYDVRSGGSKTPYFVGLGLRYLKGARICLTEERGVEWIEVVRPTLRQPLRALVLTPGARFETDGWGWSQNSFFV